MIGNGHAVGVATEIAQHLQRTAEGGLGIDDPVVAMQAADEVRELPGVGRAAEGPAQCTKVRIALMFGALNDL